MPTFLVIGAQRSGSSWLHELLRSHPSIYMPGRRKEVHYFNRYYDRGSEWYRSFFEDDRDYDAIGEATPTYLYKAQVPQRIRRDLPDAKLLLILRNPADRAFSHYMLMVQTAGYRKSFEELLAENRGPFSYGQYGRYLKRFLEYFDRDRFCILIYENAVRNVDETKVKLGEFLGVDSNSFPSEAGTSRVGASYVPRAGRTFALAKRVGNWLQANDLDDAVNLLKDPVKRLLGRRTERPVFDEKTRAQLLERYQDDIALLGSLFPLDLAAWNAGRQWKAERTA